MLIPPSAPVSDLRQALRQQTRCDETAAVRALLAQIHLAPADRERIQARAADLVKSVRNSDEKVGLMEAFLQEYGLSTDEGVTLMCLAEAMLRVPDTDTLDELIRDKVGNAAWQRHLGQSEDAFVNISTWGLMLSGKLLADEDARKGDLLKSVRRLVARVGEPVIRTATQQAMRLLGDQFVLGRDIEEALKRSEKLHPKGYTFSYDMLGEAALTAEDANRYFRAYSTAITTIAEHCVHDSVAANPGISIKLSALHPRYEQAQAARVMDELVPRVQALAQLAKSANMGLNIDAEEADRLDLSLDIIEAVSANPDLRRWEGLGVVVQAYQKRAPKVIDILADMAERHGRKLMIRLVKGAYWDAEIKLAQELGLDGYPVFTRKCHTDVSYLACAQQLLARSDVFYPQFATHNAHTAAAILEMAADKKGFEFQRLQGMGEALHQALLDQSDIPCRIYAPVGVHKDLLAYLVRRLLENGANSSFVNQLVDEAIPVEAVVADPMQESEAGQCLPNPAIPLPRALYGERLNAEGVDLNDPATLADLDQQLQHAAQVPLVSAPVVAGALRTGEAVDILNPADRSRIEGRAREASTQDVADALAHAEAGAAAWAKTPASERAACLRRMADILEARMVTCFSACIREAGKSVLDAVAEVREAVDFCRYYADQSEIALDGRQALGVVLCISPWNFPLAIFCGQVSAALAAGNAVIAKPAEQSPAIATQAVQWFHEAGIPVDVLQLLPGRGETVGAQLVADERIQGVCFTGSTEVAKIIDRQLAQRATRAPLIAETGGLNAMIVDSTALPEQAVGDIVASAFQSAGQRCSALRVLCVQEDIADGLLAMLSGAMAQLNIGDPAQLSTDVGPVIDAEAEANIRAHCDAMSQSAREVARAAGDETPGFVAPVLYEVTQLEDLKREVFGPVLHVVRFRASELDDLVQRINALNYGLTLGLHTRIDRTVERVVDSAKVGNFYVNRNQIGAIVGVQPFGGEGLSGTGPKAGGPHYLLRLTQSKAVSEAGTVDWGVKGVVDPAIWQRAKLAQRDWQESEERLSLLKRLPWCQEALDDVPEMSVKPAALPGPTGELNTLRLAPRGVLLCVAGSRAVAERQLSKALSMGNAVVLCGDASVQSLVAEVDAVCGAQLLQYVAASEAQVLQWVKEAPIEAVVCDEQGGLSQEIRRGLAARDGAILPLLHSNEPHYRFANEYTLSINTTAAGGNASLLAASDQ